MIETIAMWGGVAGLCASIVAIVVIFLTRQNILNILNKDAILFNENFNLKKEAITNAMQIADEVALRGKAVISVPEFSQRAKKCYNDLVCVASSLKIVDAFYDIAFNSNLDLTEKKVEEFKMLCRKDIGLKGKISKAIKQPNFSYPSSSGTNNSFGIAQNPTSFQSQQKPTFAEPMTRATKPSYPRTSRSTSHVGRTKIGE